jgi:hypothetical protein
MDNTQILGEVLQIKNHLPPRRYSACWVLRHIAVKNAARTDLHHHKDMKDPEPGGDGDHELTRKQRPGVVVDKCAPVLSAPTERLHRRPRFGAGVHNIIYCLNGKIT